MRDTAKRFLDSLPAYEEIACTLEGLEDASSSISIEKIRHVRNALRTIPEINTHRIIWIEPAESLTAEAANALLKILEEPPPQCIFFLFTRSARAVLGTVRSRCHIVRFPVSKKTSEPTSGPNSGFEPLFEDGRWEKFFAVSNISFEDARNIESMIAERIRSARDSVDYQKIIDTYNGFVCAVAARRNHVSEQACLDLMHLC
jgi:DNA polymerase III delta prime subunit